jgi:hypothetical protein
MTIPPQRLLQNFPDTTFRVPENSPRTVCRCQPGGATYQREEQRVNLRQVTHLRLTIVPNKSGSGTATLTALRLFA